MIAKKSYYRSTTEHKDRIVAEIYVDRDLIVVMQSRILEEIKDAAGFAKSDAENPDEIDDALNYIKDLIASYKELAMALDDIACAEGVSNIPPDEDEQE